MPLDIHERDVDEALCRACAACCHIRFRLPDTTSRYRRFLRETGWSVIPAAADGATDCCDGKHDATIDAGPCRHLASDDVDGAPRHHCSVHGTADYPDLCADYNCVSWAKANDTYTERNAVLVAAQSALDRRRAGAARDRGTEPR